MKNLFTDAKHLYPDQPDALRTWITLKETKRNDEILVKWKNKYKKTHTGGVRERNELKFNISNEWVFYIWFFLSFVHKIGERKSKKKKI